MTRRHKKSAAYADLPTTQRYYGAPMSAPGPSTPPPMQLSSSPSAVPDTDTFLRESPRYRDLGSPRAVSIIEEAPTSPEPEVAFQLIHDTPVSSAMPKPEAWELDVDVVDTKDKLDPAFDWDNDKMSSDGTSTPGPKAASRSPSPDHRLALSHVVPMSLSQPPMEEATKQPTPPPPGMPCLPPHSSAAGADFGFEFPPPPPPPPAGANAGGVPPVGAWFNPADFADLGEIPMPGPDDMPGFPFPPDMGGGMPYSPHSGWSPASAEQDGWVRLRDVASRAMSPGSAGLSVEIVEAGDMGRRGRMKRRKSKKSRLGDAPETGESRHATFSGSGSRNGDPPRLASLTPESAPVREGATVQSSRTASLLRSPPHAGSPTRSTRRSPSPGPSHPPLTVIAPSPVAVPSSVPPASPSEPAQSPIVSSMPHSVPPQSLVTVPLPVQPTRSSRASFDSNASTPPRRRSPSLPSTEQGSIASPEGSRRTWSRTSSPTPSRSQHPGQLEISPIDPLPSPKYESPRVHAEFVDAHPAFIGTWTELQRSIVECAERLDTAEGAMLEDLDAPEVVILGADPALRARLVEALVGVRLEIASDHRRPNISWTVGVPGFSSLNLDAATRFVQDAIVANSYGSGAMVPLHLGSPHSSPGGKVPSFKPRFSVFESGFDTARADRVQNAAAVIRLPGSSTIALDRAKVIDVDVHASELTDRMLKYLLRDLDDKLTKDLASRVRPCIAHMKAKATMLATRTKQDHTAVPTSVLLQRFCDGVGRAGRGIGSLEEALRVAVDAAAPAFTFPAGEPKQIEEPTPTPELKAPSGRPSIHTAPAVPLREPKTPSPKHRKMVWDWNNVSPPQLVQVPVRSPMMSPRTRSGSIRSMRSRLSHRTDVLLRPVSVASVRAPLSPAVVEPTTAVHSEFPSDEMLASSESALTRDDVVRLLECARTDELPDEFATKDVAREIMLEHVRGWDVPVMDYLDGVRASLLQDLSDLLSEHFSAVPGMRLVISKLMKSRLMNATKQAQTRLEQLLVAEQQPTVGDKTAYLKLLRVHRTKVHKALHKPGADVPLDHAAAEDVVARVMAYFEVALPRLVENVVRLVSSQLVREVCDPSTLLGLLGAADLCPAREDIEELATERAEQQRRLVEMRSIMLDLECAIALA